MFSARPVSGRKRFCPDITASLQRSPRYECWRPQPSRCWLKRAGLWRDRPRDGANRDDYRDVTTSDDPQVVAERRRFETYLQNFRLPDENDPSTRKTWQRFRASPKGAPVEVFRPASLDPE